ncbi:hypothetical protein [Nostoc sp. MG11]|uniref:hypothetical protein n=1 Tax=Nostoc sp. MG11 TaxID=2721166 RepID=UPI0018665818|nr:hypothetical protein [Nostoc sp. MG11]
MRTHTAISTCAKSVLKAVSYLNWNEMVVYLCVSIVLVQRAALYLAALVSHKSGAQHQQH